jgi:leucyl-tRNA synthetase
MHLNTAVSSLMELVNELYAFSEATARGGPAQGDRQAEPPERPQTLSCLREAIDALVVMISPFAPHTAEELWQLLGRPHELSAATWPSFEADVARPEEIVIPVQINGKVRARLTLPAGLADGELESLALADASVRAHTEGKTIRKVVVARGSLVSVVVS